eukprot:jgi/Picsp_1/498/NSC_00496-R1_---NA---
MKRVFVGRRIAPLRRVLLWPGVKTHQDLSQPIWDAVCLAYFKACDLMRRMAYAMVIETGWADTSAQEVSHTGMFTFWQALSTFVGMGGPGPTWVSTSPQIRDGGSTANPMDAYGEEATPETQEWRKRNQKIDTERREGAMYEWQGRPPLERPPGHLARLESLYIGMYPFAFCDVDDE